MRRKLISISLCILFFGAGSALAVPVWRTNPPGQPPTTYQVWTFDDNDNPAVPEVVNNIYGTPLATITVEGEVCGYPSGWYEEYLGRRGVWHGNLTTVEMWIPNRLEPLPYKEIWVEVGFRGDFIDSDVNSVPSGNIIELGHTITIAPDAWAILNIGWIIKPNPQEEFIKLVFQNSGADVDYVIVDTICDIPEPATMCMLGVGGVILAVHKRRKQIS